MSHEKEASASASPSASPSTDPSASASPSASPSPSKHKKAHKSSKKEHKVKKEKSSKKAKPEKEAKSEKKHRSSKKASKGEKRGPRGAQWKNWEIPYQPGSIFAQAFEAGAKKGGIKESDLSKLIKKAGGNATFIIRQLKKGESRGWTWSVDDSHGKIQFSHTKLADKNWKAA